MSKLAYLFVVLSVCFASAASAEEDWTVLFDGSSLEAWRGYKRDDVPKEWMIEDGCLKGTGRGGDLITREKFQDFELVLEWKIAKGGNSGIMYRVKETDKPSYFTGPEYQVLDNGKGDPKGKTAAGSLYALYPPAVDASKPGGEWNTAKIVSIDGKVEHWLNGKLVVSAELGSDDWNERVAGSKFKAWEGFGKSPEGHICVQSHGSPVWYRNVKIRVPEAEKSAAAVQEPIRLLVVTQSGGFQHSTIRRKGDGLSHTEQVLTELGLESGAFRVTCTKDVAKDFKPDFVDRFDVVMFFTTSRKNKTDSLPIDEETLDWFINDWIKQQGHGFLGVHSAADTYHNYEPYWDMLGGTFAGHPWTQNSTVTITVHDSEHPASKPWGNEYVLKDEIYQFSNWQPEKVRVLMSLNMEKTELKRPRHIPVLWVKDFGKGRVMHMSLGHREDVWTNPTYQKSLLGGLNWLAGRVDANAKPNPEVSAAEEENAKQAFELAKQKAA